MADAAKVEQVRLNLLSNAVKFTPSGGSVTLSCVATETDVHVLVQDTGVGIPLDRRGEVFEPFVQLDRSLVNPREGVGLGLAISQDAKGLQVIAHAPVGPHARTVVPSCLASSR